MKINLNNYNSIFFTSDWHIGHSREFLYEPRDCSSRDEHVNMIIDGINSQAAPDDLIIHMGDMSLTSTFEEFKSWLRQINCKNIFSITGNHDNNWLKFINERNSSTFEPDLSDILYYPLGQTNYVTLGPQQEITIIEPSGVIGKKAHRYPITLNHYPMHLWNKSHYGAYMLCGHSHGSFEKTQVKYPYGKILDCGVENSLGYHNKIMFHWEDIKKIMKEKSIVHFDHHNYNTT